MKAINIAIWSFILHPPNLPSSFKFDFTPNVNNFAYYEKSQLFFCNKKKKTHENGN